MLILKKILKKIDYKDENENGMEDGLIEDKIERNDEKMDIIDNSKKENDTKYSNMKDTNENKINSPSAKYDEKKNNFQKSKKSRKLIKNMIEEKILLKEEGKIIQTIGQEKKILQKEKIEDLKKGKMIMLKKS